MNTLGNHVFTMNSIDNSINSLGMQNSNSLSTTYAKIESDNIEKSTVDNSAEQLVMRSSTIVNISSEAQTKLAQEQSDIGKDIAQKMQAKSTDKTEKTSETDTERLDKIIAEVQEQIKEVQQEIKALNGEKTEQAQAERKALDAQLSSLNATLIGLMGKKLDELE